MQLESAQALIDALRASQLFAPEQFEEIVRELAPLNPDVTLTIKQLVRGKRITVYQLKKVIRGKAADLLIGPYVITDKLGEGGMGKVFRAHRASDSEVVALKVVRSALLANPVVRGRYAREVQTASTLAHPNIVRLFDSGESNGRFYLAMEFVDGVDLARLMHDCRTLEVPEACEYIRQAALGLQHAHEKGFVHRDIKPSNIVVAGERHLPQATEPAVVKLLDLGLARAIDPDDMVVPNLTRDHTVVGTPDYMAPEQARNSKRVDARCDLYSLGCTMYFLLTGRVPFPHGGAIDKIVAHQTELPSPVQALRPEVPAGVADLVARLMAKRPEERIQTAGELSAELEPYTRYAADAAPVVLPRREHDALETVHPGSTPLEPGALRSSSGSSLGSLSFFGLSQDEDDSKGIEPVAVVDSTPRPSDSSPDAPSKPTPRKQKNHTPLTGKAQRRGSKKLRKHAVPQAVWVMVALLGVAILSLMLWLVNSQGG